MEVLPEPITKAGREQGWRHRSRRTCGRRRKPSTTTSDHKGSSCTDPPSPVIGLVVKCFVLLDPPQDLKEAAPIISLCYSFTTTSIDQEVVEGHVNDIWEALKDLVSKKWSFPNLGIPRSRRTAASVRRLAMRCVKLIKHSQSVLWHCILAAPSRFSQRAMVVSNGSFQVWASPLGETLIHWMPSPRSLRSHLSIGRLMRSPVLRSTVFSTDRVFVIQPETSAGRRGRGTCAPWVKPPIEKPRVAALGGRVATWRPIAESC